MVQPQRVLDVGANRGQFSLVATELLPGVEIDAFEPLPEPAAIFSRLFEANPLVRLHHVALGREEALLPMNVSSKDDSSSLLAIGPGQVNAFPGTHHVGTHEVAVRRLDDMALPPLHGAFLKIDVQGYELAALEGAKRRLAEISHVYVEASFQELYMGQPGFGEIVTFLDRQGFDLVDVGGLARGKNGEALQGDFLFRSRTRPSGAE